MAIKIVEFDKWCKLCEHWEKREDEDPCFDCLNQGWNEDSTKPILYKEKGSTDNGKSERKSQ